MRYFGYAFILAVIVCSNVAWGSPLVSGRVYGEWYQRAERDWSEQNTLTSHGYAGTQIYLRNLVGFRNGSRLDAFVSMRGRQEFSADVPGDPHAFVYQGYLRYGGRSRWDVRVGRQFLSSGVGGRTGDGVRVAYRLGRRIELIAFGAASLDTRAPQSRRRLADFWWSGARLQVRTGEFLVAPAVQFDKRFGRWVGQLAGGDLAYRGRKHQLDLRLFFDIERNLLDEFRLGYTLLAGDSWRLPIRFRERLPRLSEELSNLGDADQELLGEERYTMLSLYPEVSLGWRVRLAADMSIVYAADWRTYRQGVRLMIKSVEVAYRRRSGHGPTEDRVWLRGERRLRTNLKIHASVAMSQLSLGATGSSSDRQLSSGVLGATWTPTQRWSVIGECQALDTEARKYDVRGYARVEMRFGGAR